jgi:hypothetical protein
LLGLWRRCLCGFLLLVLSSAVGADPAEELERAWTARDESALVELHTPDCWNDEQDSGRRVYWQIKNKPLEFRLSDYRVEGERGVATYDVYQNGRLADRVYTYFLDDRVVAYDENEEHAALYLLGLVEGRLRLEELKGSQPLDTLGREFLLQPPMGHEQRFPKDTVYQRSRLLPETGLAFLFYGNPDDEFALKVTRAGQDWRFVSISFLPSVRGLIPDDPGLIACTKNMNALTKEIELFSAENDGRYPESLAELNTYTTCPKTQRDYYYTVTADLRWYGVCCEGNTHISPNYPAASRGSGLRLASTGSRYRDCKEKLLSLLPLLEKYKDENGTYPQVLAYLADKPGVHLPRCSQDNLVWAPNETDYALMHLPGGLHLFCTTVEHTGERFAPLQPSFINGMPAKAVFLLAPPAGEN